MASSAYLRWSLAALTVVAVCLPHVAHAHQRLVGVIQATAQPDQNRVTVLLKLEVRALMEALDLGEIADDDPRLLVTSKGRHRIFDLLRRTHEVESWSGVCERDQIDRLELTPSQAWLDIQITYRCPAPMHYVMVRLDTLLDEEGHRIVGDFDSGSGPERVTYNRRARRHFLLFGPAEPVASAAAEPEAEAAAPTPTPPVESPGSAAVLLHVELFVLVLALAGGVGARRDRGLLAGGAAAMGVGGAAVAGWIGPSWVPAMAGILGLVAVAGLSARCLVMGQAMSRADAVAGVLAAVLAGMSAARDGVVVAAPGVFAFYGVLAVSGLAGLAFSQGTRGRRARGFLCIAALIFLGVGEAFRVV